ncbi:MAG TPA: hypothetical protein VG028_08625 [Terriglobia bacterium]|nr:hypothetical protein [Terriglobia bacterium]
MGFSLRLHFVLFPVVPVALMLRTLPQNSLVKQGRTVRGLFVG